ncbi:30S ribosomal protein S4 [Thermacetogenium phaeum DSM 12270]|jgi:small subunit ribosomal protein S4|uniref:Small ribosomal subunit protein uS4 n=2 Tax=Thermacetogenium phaeum TaxID=85874 RepID=K4LKY4_THEPS|nr:30S ribosomal protein S4 [Thermacetogenium phaeum]MDK2880486.1 small subunit ribosomal protein [Clostridia bacterium]MDN5364842.1 small subunit ribosomal protein [Thermacetogenium sp.]AFV12732.1 30S ribosomal protein S4 [Thermacetogenium phaeum DSM 12270]KUK37214.1 MAG: 30S ribosomal protein S4 [Thermacetogenium phaeum]MDN5375251.1 small subunit ribosomal protein [Thermacetogenium sp.]
MARYTGPVCRLCRREGIKLYLKGDRCYSEKCAIDRRSYPPGQKGFARKKITEYGLQLREKQRARRIYGVLERQFRRYFEMAERQKGVTGENLLRLLERRLDNVVYRLGFARSRPEARQLVRHGHFTVNGRRVNIPSYLVRVGDEIAVSEKSREIPLFKEIAETIAQKTPPPWLEVDAERMRGRVAGIPAREDIDVPIQEHLIVELYSR